MPTEVQSMPCCPYCEQLCDDDDKMEVEGGQFYHINCYRRACIEGNLLDPFPPCDDCKQLIWQTTVVEHGTVYDYMDGNKPRVGKYHPECVPGNKVNDGRAYDDPVPDDVSQLVESKRTDHDEFITSTSKSLGGPEVVTSIPPSSHDTCPICDKLVLRSRTEVVIEGVKHIAHKACARKVGEDGKVVLKASRERRARIGNSVECCSCHQNVTGTQQKAGLLITCDGDTEGEKDHYHKKCYRQACIDGGMDDPFPPESKVRKVKVVCPLGEVEIERDQFPEHVALHEELDTDDCHVVIGIANGEEGVEHPSQQEGEENAESCAGNATGQPEPV